MNYSHNSFFIPAIFTTQLKMEDQAKYPGQNKFTWEIIFLADQLIYNFPAIPFSNIGINSLNATLKPLLVAIFALLYPNTLS